MRRHISTLLILLVCVSVRAAVGHAADLYPTAILNFEERAGGTKDMGVKVADLLFAELAADAELYLVDRADLKKTLDEQDLQLSGLVKPAEAVQVGNMTGAKLIVTGSVIQVDKSLHLVAKIISVETTRVVGASAKGAAADDLSTIVAKLAAGVAKTIKDRGAELAPAPPKSVDRAAEFKKKMADKKLPTVTVDIPERHIGQTTFDPAAQTEVMLFCTEGGFTVLEPNATNVKPDVALRGEALSEFVVRRTNGGLMTVRGRVELRAVELATGKILAVDRQTEFAVDASEQLAGKAALQKAAATLAERMLPKLAVAK